MKTTFYKTRQQTALLLVALAMSSFIRHSQAATQVWQGLGSDANWSTSGNFSLSPLAPGDSLVFDGSVRTTSNNDITDFTPGYFSLTFNPGAASFTLQGNGLELSAGIVNNSPNLQTLSFSPFSANYGGIGVNASQTWNAAAGDILVTSNVTLDNSLTSPIALTIDGSHNTTISGVINESTAGTGSLVKNGTGTLLLTGSNTYSGGTTINAGTVKAGSPTALGMGNVLVTGGVLTGNAPPPPQSPYGNNPQSGAPGFSSSYSIGGTPFGGTSGSEVVTGQPNNGGTTIVTSGGYITTGGGGGIITVGDLGGGGGSGGSAITGGTGTLTFSGSLTISSGGGDLTVGGLTFGTLTSGNSTIIDPPPINVFGNYTQTGGTLLLHIYGKGAGDFEYLNVQGTATLSGTLALSISGYIPQRGDQLTLVVAQGGITGQFDQIIGSTGTILVPVIFYGANDVTAVLAQGSFAGFAEFYHLTPNETAVARGLDRVAFDPRTAVLISALDSELLVNLPHDFDLLSPEALTSLYSVSFSFADVQAANIENHLADVRNENTPAANLGVSVRGDDSSIGLRKDDDKKTVSTPSAETSRWNLFMEGSGDFIRVNGDINAAGYSFTTGGVTVGADYRLCEHCTIGVMAGYADTGATLTQGGNVDVNSGRLGIYSTTYGNGFYLDTLASGGYNSYDTHRTGLLGIAQGDTGGEEFDGLINGGYDIQQGNWTVGPIASAQYTYVGITSFNENGSLAPLSFPSQSQDSFRTRAGFKVSSLWHIAGIAITPTLSAAWQHEYLDTAYALDSSFASGPGNVFTVNGPALGRDSVVVNTGVNFQWTDRFATYLSYYGELGRKNYELNSVSGGARVNF